MKRKTAETKCQPALPRLQASIPFRFCKKRQTSDGRAFYIMQIAKNKKNKPLQLMALVVKNTRQNFVV